MATPDIIKSLALARRLLEAAAEGRLDLNGVKDMSDEELATYDTEAYKELTDAIAENDRLIEGQ